MKKSSKILAGILIGGVLATSGALVGCGSDNSGKPLSTTTEVYGFAGATTGMLLSNNDLASSMAASVGIQSGESVAPGVDKIKEQIDNAITQTLDKYMDVFDSVVGGKKPVNVVDGTSDKEEYKHKLTVTVNTINGESTSCVLYFNETLLDGDDDVDDSDKEERETKLEGELYLNGSETPLYIVGRKEIDTEDNEMEVTFEVRLSKEDDTHKVVFKQEHEQKDGKTEVEYKFQIVMGKVITEFSFELEKDAKGNIEVEYEQVVGDVTISFEIEKKNNNSITIKTKDFMGVELELNVRVEKSEDNTQERYVYTLIKLGESELEGTVKFVGNWR